MTEMPDDVRVPLHELQADVDYLIGRVVADGSCAPAMAASIKQKLAAIESAIQSRAPAQPTQATGANDKELGKHLGAYLGMSGIDAEDIAHVRAMLSPAQCSAGKESEPPEGQLAGRDCPGVLESDPALFNILNNALGTMHYHRLMSALNWNGYVITREPQTAWSPTDIKTIAAIIDPSAWKMEDGFIVEQSHSDESISKAGAILESLRVEYLVGALRTIGELEPVRQATDGTYDFVPKLGAVQSCALARQTLGLGSSALSRPTLGRDGGDK